jgi:hypothetical protein
MTTPLGTRLVHDRWAGLAISFAASKDTVETLGQPWTVKTDPNVRRELLSDVLSTLSKDKAEEHALLHALIPGVDYGEHAGRPVADRCEQHYTLEAGAEWLLASPAAAGEAACRNRARVERAIDQLLDVLRPAAAAEGVAGAAARAAAEVKFTGLRAEAVVFASGPLLA